MLRRSRQFFIFFKIKNEQRIRQSDPSRSVSTLAVGPFTAIRAQTAAAVSAYPRPLFLSQPPPPPGPRSVLTKDPQPVIVTGFR